MTDDGFRAEHETADAAQAEDPGVEVARTPPADEPPASTSWPTVSTPWGTPGNHLTGPIPRIRRRDDGSLTHGEQS